MSEFLYTAVDAQGREHRGALDQPSSSRALERLRQMGLFPLRMGERTAGRKAAAFAGTATERGHERWAIFGTGIRQREVAAFTRQLATLIRAGIPVMKAIRAIERQEQNPRFRRLERGLVEAIEGGSMVSEALARYPRVFSKLYINMVVAGETGGMLEETLARLGDLLERIERLKRRIQSAMFYPAAVITVSIVVMAVLLVFVVPRFQAVFADMSGGRPLPAFTQAVMAFAQGVKGHVLYLVAGLAGLIVVWRQAAGTRFGRRALDRLKLKLPLLGGLCQKLAIARLCRTLGTLLNNGVPILQAISITRETTGNMVFSSTLDELHRQVKEGESITPALETSRLFPSTVISMIDVGEQTGALPNMMLQVADSFDEMVDTSINALLSLLEPILIVFLAIVVGCIVIALFLPILSLIDGGLDNPNRGLDQVN